MGDIVLFLIMQALEAALQGAADAGIKYVLRKIYDDSGKFTTKILYEIDTDGDGVGDISEVLYTFNTCMPSFDSSGCCIVNKGNKVGYGLPQYQLVDAYEVVDYLSSNGFELTTVTGNDQGYLIDYDRDGDVDDVLLPMPFDATGDGVNDWGWILDVDDNGIPDASPDFPFYPVGSPEFHEIVSNNSPSSPSIIMVSPEGDLTVYDMNGDITQENCETAYSIWLSENSALDKPFSSYSVSEAILFMCLISIIPVSLSLIFRRR